MDEFDEFEQLDYGDDFEDKYADELEALDDLEDDIESPIQRTKRRLNFGTEADCLEEGKKQTPNNGICEPSNKRQRTDEYVETDGSECAVVLQNSQKNQTNDDLPCVFQAQTDKCRTLKEEDCSKFPKSDFSDDFLLRFRSPADDIKLFNGVKTSQLAKTKANFATTRPCHEKISFTTFDGNICHLPLREESFFSAQHIEVSKMCVIAQTYAEMRDEAFRLLEMKTNLLLQGEEQGHKESKANHNLLWVEKFKPRDFLELLSDDGINRALLSWLKLWDKVVFKREAPKKPPKKEGTGPQTKPKFQEVIRELDELGRPQQKIALLCGPPGLGKTTLAFIIAKQVGYNVVEMNASDDRSPDVFKRQLESATQMRAVLGKEPRPNCLIIDEVDGAVAPAINTLVAFAKNTKNNVLLRPVICICNDLYTPALRPLRQMSLVLMFPQTCSARLVTRLLEISRFQQLKTDRSALVALCEKADNDIRSCLSTIQFLHTLKGELKLRDVKSVNVGQKDSQTSMFSVWQHIFQIPRSQKKTGFHSHIKDGSSSDNGKLSTILKLVLSCGEYEKLLQGIFENFLNVNYRDPDLNRTSLGADWMCYASELEQVIAHLQVYAVMPYIPYVVVAFHFLYAVNTNVTVTYPSAQFEFKTNLSKRENIVTTMLQDMSPIARSSLHLKEIVLSFLPSLLHIVQPSLRPVNTQLYSNREKLDLQHVIDTMVMYNLNYRQERNSEGLYQFVLEPNISDVISFPGLNPPNTLSYSAKQLIARELELERMRQSESKGNKLLATHKNEKTDKAPALPNHLQVLKAKPVIEEQTEATDFFGRRIVKVNKRESSSMEGGNVWYKFKEGYTNAARKTLYMRDLL